MGGNYTVSEEVLGLTFALKMLLQQESYRVRFPIPTSLKVEKKENF